MKDKFSKLAALLKEANALINEINAEGTVVIGADVRNLDGLPSVQMAGVLPQEKEARAFWGHSDLRNCDLWEESTYKDGVLFYTLLQEGKNAKVAV